MKENASSTFVKIQFTTFLFIVAIFFTIINFLGKTFHHKVLFCDSPDSDALLFQFLLDEFDVNVGGTLPGKKADRRCNTRTLLETIIHA